MSAMNIFFESRVRLSKNDVLNIVRESVLGFALVVSLGYLALSISRQVKGFDALVAAVILGMAVRTVLGTRDAVFFKVLPGIILAQSVFIPLGIILYGKNLEIKILLAANPLVLVQVTMITFFTFVLMYLIGKWKWFRIKDKMLYLLSFGSAVCGASAIAITSPIVECEPDDTAVALVNNTIAVVLGLALISWLLRPLLSSMEYAALAGSLLHQTGFVKTALAEAARDVYAFGLAVKSLRIALLVVSIPIISYLIRKRIFIPWYLVLFILAGFVFSYVPLAREVTQAVTSVYEISFTAALASVGLNADIRKVTGKLLKPLVLIGVVFLLDVALFMLSHSFIPSFVK